MTEPMSVPPTWMEEIGEDEDIAYREFRQSATDLKLANDAVEQAKLKFTAALGKLCEAAAPTK